MAKTGKKLTKQCHWKYDKMLSYYKDKVCKEN